MKKKTQSRSRLAVPAPPTLQALLWPKRNACAVLPQSRVWTGAQGAHAVCAASLPAPRVGWDRFLPVEVFGPESGGQPDSCQEAYHLFIYSSQGLAGNRLGPGPGTVPVFTPCQNPGRHRSSPEHRCWWLTVNGHVGDCSHPWLFGCSPGQNGQPAWDSLNPFSSPWHGVCTWPRAGGHPAGLKP